MSSDTNDQQLTYAGMKAVERFLRAHDESYKLLACHAAAPLVLTPDLVNLLRNKFLRGQVPWVAEADLLLSELCRPIGYEQYVMDADVRAYLLSEMEKDPTLGTERLRQIARLLIRYIRHLAHTNLHLPSHDLQAQQWAAMAFLDNLREQVIRDIAAAYRDCVTPIAPGSISTSSQIDRTEMARLSRITADLAPSLNSHPELVRYAELVTQLLQDHDGEKAKGLSQSAALDQSIQVAGVSLPPLSMLTKPETWKIHPLHRGWALVVGVDSYHDRRIPDLNYAVNDAETMQVVFELTGYSTECLHSDMASTGLLPTRVNVLAQVARIAASAVSTDVIWLHFSGHGKSEDGRQYLLTSDTNLDNLDATAIAVDHLTQIARTANARGVVVTLGAEQVGLPLRSVLHPEAYQRLRSRDTQSVPDLKDTDVVICFSDSDALEAISLAIRIEDAIGQQPVLIDSSVSVAKASTREVERTFLRGRAFLLLIGKAGVSEKQRLYLELALRNPDMSLPIVGVLVPGADMQRLRSIVELTAVPYWIDLRLDASHARLQKLTDLIQAESYRRFNSNVAASYQVPASDLLEPVQTGGERVSFAAADNEYRRYMAKLRFRWEDQEDEAYDNQVIKDPAMALPLVLITASTSAVTELAITERGSSLLVEFLSVILTQAGSGQPNEVTVSALLSALYQLYLNLVHDPEQFPTVRYTSSDDFPLAVVYAESRELNWPMVISPVLLPRLTPLFPERVLVGAHLTDVNVIAERLSAVPLIRSLTDTQKGRLARLAAELSFEPGEVICHSSDKEGHLWIIDWGQVRITQQMQTELSTEGELTAVRPTLPFVFQQGFDSLPHLLTAGNYFVGGLIGIPHQLCVTAEAATKVNLIRISASHVEWLEKHFSDFQVMLRQRPMLSRRLKVALSNEPLFADLLDTDWESLETITGWRHVPAGLDVTRQGEAGSVLYVLAAGEGLVRGTDDEGREKPRHYFRVGVRDYYGINSLLQSDHHTATVTSMFGAGPTFETLNGTDWLTIQREDLAQLLQDDQALWQPTRLYYEFESRQERPSSWRRVLRFGRKSKT